MAKILSEKEEDRQMLMMAARVMVASENPKDIIVQSARPYRQRVVLKFAHHIDAQPLAGSHTPGTFTNQMQKSFTDPRFLILIDPRIDHQHIKEETLGNIPTIASYDNQGGCSWDLVFYRVPEEAKDQEADMGVALVANFDVPVARLDTAWESVAPPVHVDAPVIPPAVGLE
ncbi:hypothetical protein MKX03_005475 [Papaver bracteatum]|nr:hypothetical protein MKX03_005475 [Papaver bracteatum]